MARQGSFVTGDPNIGRPKKDGEGPKYWNTGPPYLATVKDMYDIAVLWTDYAPRVSFIHPGLFAEMQGAIFLLFALAIKAKEEGTKIIPPNHSTDSSFDFVGRIHLGNL